MIEGAKERLVEWWSEKFPDSMENFERARSLCFSREMGLYDYFCYLINDYLEHLEKFDEPWLKEFFDVWEESLTIFATDFEGAGNLLLDLTQIELFEFLSKDELEKAISILKEGLLKEMAKKKLLHI